MVFADLFGNLLVFSVKTGHLTAYPAPRLQAVNAFGIWDEARCWYATKDGKLWLFDTRSGQRQALPLPPRAEVTAVFPPAPGDSLRWLATTELGLLAWQPRTGRVAALPMSGVDPALALNTGWEAPDGTRWLGSAEGLLRVDAQPFIRQERFPFFRERRIQRLRVVVPHRSNPRWHWVATANDGLFLYDVVQRKPLRRLFESATEENPLGQAYYDADGAFWVTNNTGLYRMEHDAHLRRVFATDSLMPNRGPKLGPSFWAVAGAGGVQYLALGRRVWAFDARTGRTRRLFQTTTDVDGLYLRARQREVWAVSGDACWRWQVKEARLRRFRPSGGVVLTGDLTDDSTTGTLWLGCPGALLRLDTDQARYRVYRPDSTLDLRPKSLVLDRRGTLWANSFDGLYAFQPATRRWARFTTADGLMHNDGYGSLYRVGDEVYLNHNEGYTAFRPERFTFEAPRARPLLTGFRLFDQPQPFHPDSAARRDFRVRHDQNVLGFEFTATDFSQAEKITFHYRLDGFDEGWVAAGTRRTATYTNLDGGRYTFRVRALNAFGQAHPEEARFRIFVETPYWRAWWFYALLALALAGLVAAGVRYRYLQQLRLLRLRANLARDLHDDVGSYLGSISLMSQSAETLAARRAEGTGEVVRKMGETARQAMDLMADIVWSVNPAHDGLDQVVQRLRDFAGELFENGPARLRFDADAEVLALKLPLEKRRDFYLVGKEALANAARYAGATEVVVALTRADGRLRLTVRDDGVGFDPTHPPPTRGGNGLGNMAARARNLGGTLRVDAAPGRGTTVSLEFPLA